MLYVIHGDDIEKSFKKLDELTHNKGALHFDLKENLLAFKTNLIGQELFAAKKTVVVNRFNALSAPQRKEIIPLIEEFSKENDVLIYSQSSIDKRIVDSFKKADVSVFLLPKVFFQFLDTLEPSTFKNSARLLSVLMESSTDEQIFYSVMKRIRLLILLKANVQNSDVLALQSWQKGNLMKQVQKWKDTELISFYKSLFELEKMMKTSMLPMSLYHNLDILLLGRV